MATVLAFGATANAAEVKVLCPGAMRSAMQEVAAAFDKATGNHVAVAHATAGGVEQRIISGERVDVVVVTKPRIDKLAAAGKVAGNTIAVLGRSPIALAVKAGAAKPDISSVEAVKKALLDAKSIAYTDPASGGTSGIHFARELQRLGIAAEIAPKAKLINGANGAPPAVGEAVAKGEAELGFQPISELNGVAGIDIVGPLPAELQTADLTYAAALSADPPDRQAGKALLAFLAGPNGAAVIKAKGLVPGDGR